MGALDHHDQPKCQPTHRRSLYQVRLHSSVRIAVGRQVLLAAVLGAGGCGKPASTSSQPPGGVVGGIVGSVSNEPWPILSTDLLALVPADTPYVFAAEEPLPQEAIERLDPVLAPLVQLAELAFAEAYDDAEPDFKRALDAVFGGKPTLDRAKAIGLDFNPRFVFYGIGMAPVLRIRLRDREAFVAALRRGAEVDGRVGAVPDFHGQSYIADVDEESGTETIAAVVGPDLVLTWLPEGGPREELLALAFGQRLPERSLAQSGALDEVRRRHGLTHSAGGYFDWEQLAAGALGYASPLQTRVAAAYVGAPPDDPVCKAEMLRLLSYAPRLVTGWTAGNATLSWATTVELEPSVAKRVAKLPDAIPQIAVPEGGALGTFGMGLNLEALVELVRAYADELKRQPFQCELFTELNDTSALTSAFDELPPQLMKLSGFSVSVHDFVFEPEKRIDMVMVADLDDPKGALEALAKKSPELRPDKLRLRKPVRLNKVFDKDSVPQDVWVAMGKHSIGVTIGNVGRRPLLSSLDRRRPADGTIMLWSFDTAEWIARDPNRVEKLYRLEGQLGMEFIAGFVELMSAAEMRLEATELGLRLAVDVRE